ncbi:tRNA uridine-5-carboxymethylaminomethyl(34) synthesis GTPase MnmE [Caldanaerobius polysaccharolyticus]|uniref:tRNA uridine-5-carboxymethylaminomethyl(34) synthesis GTPase MnmE n=1 Tax=Caldanaerobius polysaccharolyticus TaxID=44256 RepID=UPI000479FED1|nr:tRNA uridine-5-carboxymethylaminomethyl(34) synthesis GTPase MnmE [Caldanaerobius polysaccharolyticus]
MNTDDTICAISTPIGEGGIGIVRISGPEALEILSKIFSAGKKVFDFKSHTVHHGFILDPKDGKVVDEVLVTYMKAPKTYTRQDVVEINCHGGVMPLKKVLDLTISCGARLAEPGEFTLRAFVNGRIDLSQAEAVIDLIRSKTDLSHTASINQLRGGISDRVNAIIQRLLDLYAHIEALNDFPEDEVEPLYDGEIPDVIGQCMEQIRVLLDTYDSGRILREGLNVVIVGKPNVGKSSLLNAILKENRAIVTDIPGTTRDAIEEYVNIKGVPVKIVDTAGIRSTKDVVEKIGVEKSLEYLNKADLILFVVDASGPIDESDLNIIEHLKRKEVIVVVNKVDLSVNIEVKRLEHLGDVVEISAKTGEGLDRLYDLIYSRGFEQKASSDGIANRVFINARHRSLLSHALESLENCKATFGNGLPMDFVSIDLKSAIDSLGEITGRVVSDEVLHNIFDRFCIGK